MIVNGQGNALVKFFMKAIYPMMLKKTQRWKALFFAPCVFQGVFLFHFPTFSRIVVYYYLIKVSDFN